MQGAVFSNHIVLVHLVVVFPWPEAMGFGANPIIQIMQPHDSGIGLVVLQLDDYIMIDVVEFYYHYLDR